MFCQLLQFIVEAQAEILQSLRCQAGKSEAHSLPSRQEMCALISRLSFMSSLYLMLLLGNIYEIAMETCPVI